MKLSKFQRYLIRRTLVAILTIFLVISFNFFLFRILPGNVVDILFRSHRLTPQEEAALYKEFGLNYPIWIQYLIYIKNTVMGNLGISFVYHQPVSSILFPAIINSLILLTPSVIIQILLGIYTGMRAAWYKSTKKEYLITVPSLILWAIPFYWLASMLILVAIPLNIPIYGMYTTGMTYPSIFDKILNLLSHLILPTITLSLLSFGSWTIIVRSLTIDVLSEDYIITAKSKGADDRRVLNIHARPNIMLPTLTMIILGLGGLVGGAVIVEAVFNWPGVGWLIYNSITTRDYPILQGAFLVIAVAMVLANYIADLLYGYLDPRVKYQ